MRSTCIVSTIEFNVCMCLSNESDLFLKNKHVSTVFMVYAANVVS